MGKGYQKLEDDSDVGGAVQDCPLKKKDKQLDLAAASFLMTAHSGATTREPIEIFQNADGLFVCAYPGSWQVQVLDEALPEKAAVDIRLPGESDTLAYERVEAYRSIGGDEDGFAILNRTMREELADADVHAGDIELMPEDVEVNTLQQRWVGDCRLPSGDGTLAAVFRRGRDVWLSGVMLCPNKEANPLAWMRGKRVFEIMVASLEQPPEK